MYIYNDRHKIAMLLNIQNSIQVFIFFLLLPLLTICL
jgi:hypothetical protein